MEMTGAALRRKWRRSREGIVGGVCAGLGRTLGIEPWALRAIWLGLVLLAGTGLLLYVLCWFALPHEDSEEEADRPVLLGVCRRIARQADVDVGFVRLTAAVLIAGSLGTGTIVYVLLHFLLKEPESAP